MEESEKYIVVIEIGNTRTKVGWKIINSNKEFSYGINFSKSFLKP